MAVETKQLESGYAVIAISGRLALGGETEKLNAAITALLQKDQKRFILDITSLDYVDSSGLGQLVALWSSVRMKDGNLCILRPSDRVRRLLSVTRLNVIFDMFEEEERATSAVRRGL